MEFVPKFPKTEPGRNDPCWCGSGHKFKVCHLDRSSEQPFPPGRILKELSKIRMKSHCLYPVINSMSCNKPIRSHTISKSISLSAIADDTNHVLTFYPPVPAKEGGMVLHTTGINDASTFLGLCGKHDSEVFSQIDREQFSYSLEQCFLHTYRTVCHELYQKQSVFDSSSYMLRNFDRGEPFQIQKFIQTYLQVQAAGVRKGLENVKYLKSKLDEFLLAKEFTSFSHVAIKFEGKVCVLTAGTPTPDRDLNGKEIQALHKVTSNIQYLSIVIIPNSTGGTLLLSWQTSSSIIQSFVEQIISIPINTLSHFVIQYVFMHLENTFFSIDWWQGLPPEIQKHMSSLAAISNPYYSREKFIKDVSIPWQITDIIRINV